MSVKLCKVNFFLDAGCKFALGATPPEFWSAIGHDCLERFPSDEHIATLLYGDEGTYNNSTFLCLHFMGDCRPKVHE